MSYTTFPHSIQVEKATTIVTNTLFNDNSIIVFFLIVPLQCIMCCSFDVLLPNMVLRWVGFYKSHLDGPVRKELYDVLVHIKHRNIVSVWRGLL